MEKLEKSVKMGKTVYRVEVRDDEIVATATTFPLGSQYGNCYWDDWTIDTVYSKGWAKASVGGGGNGYARRGSMVESWVDSTGYVRKAKAEAFKAEVIAKLEKAEDGTPDVKEVFDFVSNFVRNFAVNEEEE
jgi:hypothetical protein